MKADSWAHPPRTSIFGCGTDSGGSKNDTNPPKVSFDDCVRVVLIQSRSELKENQRYPTDRLWWTRDEYQDFAKFALKVKNNYGDISQCYDDEHLLDGKKGVSEPKNADSSFLPKVRQ